MYVNFGINPFTVSSGLSFTRILGSISKTLGIIRGVAPIYRDMKPIFQKVPLLFERLNAVRNGVSNFKIPTNNYMQEVTKNVEQMSIKGPNFFQ